MHPETENQNGLPPVIDTTPESEQFYESTNYPTETLTAETITELAANFAGEKVAVIDLDGTVADSMVPFCEALNEHFQSEAGVDLDYQPEHNVSFNILDTLTRKYPDLNHSFTPETVYGIFDNPQVFIDAKPLYAAATLVKALKDVGYKIIYATSRPEHVHGIVEATQKWLSTYDMPVDYLFFENQRTTGTSKADLIAALAPVVAEGSIFYDDKPQTLAETEKALKSLQSAAMPTNIFVGSCED